MWFWWFIFVCNLLIPITMLVIGRILWKNTPKQINSVFGYRTTRSMQNMDTWTFANRYCGRLWWRFGWLLLVLTIFVQLPFYGSDVKTIGVLSLVLITVQLIALLLTIIPTERALKARFYKNGTPR